MKKSMRTLLLIFFTIVLTFSAWQLWRILGSYQEGRNRYHDLEQYVSFGESVEPTEPSQTDTTASEETEGICTERTEGPDLSAWPQVDFAQLSQINPDIVGWIFIEGTDINYPVVQGSDNDYYLRHLFDGTYNRSGCIFLDADCASDFSDRHSILHGHNMKDNSMFSGLMEYKDQTFYDEHSAALLVTPTAYYRIQFFSGYVSDTQSNAWDLRFDDDEYISWLNDIQKRSCFTTDNAPAKEDRVVTLSTCTYEFDSARFVLHGYIAEVIENTTPDA